MKTRTRLSWALFFLIVLSGWPVAQAGATEMFEEMSTGDMLYVRGLISSVSLEKMEISVRPPKEKRVVITIDPDTTFEGVERIDELKKKQQVKVWYSPDKDANRAVKIVKMMELGC